MGQRAHKAKRSLHRRGEWGVLVSRDEAWPDGHTCGFMFASRSLAGKGIPLTAPGHVSEGVMGLLKRLKIIAISYINRRGRFGLCFNLIAASYNMELANPS